MFTFYTCAVGTLRQHINTAAEQLRESASRLRSGTVSVLDAALTFEPDTYGGELVVLHLTLSDPPLGADTWPIDDLLEIYRIIDDTAIALELSLPWHVRVHSEHPEKPDEPTLYERDFF
jgi:hypothetical protein